MYIYEDLVVVDNFDYSPDEYNRIYDEMKEIKNPQILINRQQALSSPEQFQKLCSDFKHHDIIIYFDDDLYADGHSNNDVFNEEETQILKGNYKICKANNCELYLSDLPYNSGEMTRNKIPFTTSLAASEKLNSWVQEIESARVNGKPLSPFEKYLYAYMIVTEFKYSQSEDINESRDLSRVLTGNKIVCVGFAHLLSELCGRIGIACKPQALYRGFSSLRKGDESNHENCMVYLNDPKYGIEGFFMADACWDSYKDFDRPKTLTHSLIKYSDIPKIFKNEKAVTFVEDEDEKRSSFKFLKRLNAIPDIKLLEDSENSEHEAMVRLKNGEYDEDIDRLISNTFNYISEEIAEDNKPFESMVKFDSIEQGYKFAAKCAIASFCDESSNNAGIDQDEAYEEFMDIIKTMQTKFSVSLKDFKHNVMQNIKDLNIENDRELFVALANYTDAKIIDETFDKLKTIKMNYSKGPTYDAYKEALENVLISKGTRKEKAKKLAEKKLRQSDAYAYAYWENPENDTENAFAKKLIEYINAHDKKND